jgi:tricarballylate dehydrogenase
MGAAHDFDVVIAGCGIAGLSAAASAAEHGARVAVLERATFDERGGNTRYTEAFLRMKSEDAVSDDFETHFAQNAAGYVDPSLIAAAAQPYGDWSPLLKALGFADPELVSAFADGAPPTIAWLKEMGVRFDFLPTPHLTRNAPKLMPVGGGLALIEALAARAGSRGVQFFYETTAQSLMRGEDDAIRGIVARTRGCGRTEFRGSAVILACGGFEGSPRMMTQYLGPQSLHLRPVARGGYYNKGEGIRMGLAAGAAPCGDYGNYHAEPIDPRSGMTEPSLFIFPYGILVNLRGERFADEAPGTVDATYERITRQVPFQPEGIAWIVLDDKVKEIPNYRVAIRTDQPPVEAMSLEALAHATGIDAAGLAATVGAYNSACAPGRFSPLELDGLATQGIAPRKSNFARPLDRPPYIAYPMIAANVLTFGGLKVNANAQVLDENGEPIAGLYAGGEVIGIYYKAYTGATSVLRGAVFGRIAGAHAARAATGESMR